ncbi:MAG: transcription-repair coupling factor [Planctomycetota bacterium]
MPARKAAPATDAIIESPLSAIAGSAPLRALAAALEDRNRIAAVGASGSSTPLLAVAVARAISRPVLLVVAHLDEADEIDAELESEGVERVLLPALQALPGESAVAADLLVSRLTALRRIRALPAALPSVVVAPIHALMQLAPPPESAADLVLPIARGDERPPADIVDWLAEAGYRRVDAIEEPGEFAQRGGILDIFSPGDAPPVRLDFFGDEIDRITEIDLDTMGSDRAIDAVDLVTARPERALDRSTVSPIEMMPAETAVLLAETIEVVEQGRGYYERATDAGAIEGPPKVLARLEARARGFAEINAFSTGSGGQRIDLPVSPLPELSRDASEATAELAQMSTERAVFVACQNEIELKHLAELAAEHAPDAPIRALPRYVHRGFVFADAGEPGALAVVPYHELRHRFEAKRRPARLRAGRAMDTFIDLAPGDFVVHQDHGIARFVGLELLPLRAKKQIGPKSSGAKTRQRKGEELQEYLTLEFAGSSRLHVPANQIDLVQKYVGGFSGKPPLSTVGGSKWKNAKAKVTESVRDLAAEMLRVRAARQHLPGVRFPADTGWQREFEDDFPYQETEDQLAALVEIKKDMQHARPMDRLICGDVGFGKTELAIRAAFKACEFGKQVAVLVPTTVLAEQHHQTFRSRFADYPFRVESLSRFRNTKEINATLAAARKGQVDVIIGTHRLLSKDVRFADLGLVIVDEEQRFGVEHKERLLQLRTTVDMLTLSATPIPRTLHMSMLGLRDISSLTTAPRDRRAIVTEVIPYNAQRIKRAIDRELAREGQVYYIHNRVHDIRTVADDVQKLAPDAKIVVGHGQMQPAELESVMLRFMRREADILVATTIVESGIDNPTANTIVIDDADRFGLADLHQLRGRVGRYKHRAYCYLLLPPDRPVKEVAQKRLKALEEYSMLGAGFKIAMRDLEIRGAGNLLGAEQSGHIALVGYEMYCQLLERAVQDLSRAPDDKPVSQTTLDLGIVAAIPRPYIPSDARRLEAYRRVATAASEQALEQARADLTSAYGEPPAAVERLLDLARLRVALNDLSVRALAVRDPDVVFLSPAPQRVAEALKTDRDANAVRVIEAELAQTNAGRDAGEPMAEVYFRPPPSYLERDSLLRVLLARLTGRSRHPT